MAEFGVRTLLVRGRIYTGDWRGETVTDALWVEDGVVKATGLGARTRGKPREVWQLGAQECAVPGFWDSHIHLMDYGLSLDEVQLEGLTSGAEVTQRLAQAMGRTGFPATGPVLGRGWMVGAWRGALPHRKDLDGLGDRPVLLWNHDYHSLWVNSAVLRACAVDAATPDPDGGRIERDPDGSPSGVLRDSAVDRVRHLFPAATPERAERAILRAQESLLALGVTAVCAMDEGPDCVRALVRLHRAGKLRLRVGVYPPARQVESLAGLGLATGLGDDRLWLGGVKAFMDGALGSQTAWMREPYDGIGGTGLAMPFARDLARSVARLRAADLRLALHAIGDRAVTEAVDTLQAAPPAVGRDRIEHAQLVAPDVVARWSAERLCASVQPVHLTDDLELMARFWGTARSAWVLPLKSLLDRGVPLLFGSDAPVSTPDPLRGLWAAVERRRPGGEALNPQERITPTQALEAYAAQPALAEGRPHLGRLLPGSPLSMAVLNADPDGQESDLSQLRVVGVEGA